MGSVFAVPLSEEGKLRKREKLACGHSGWQLRNGLCRMCTAGDEVAPCGHKVTRLRVDGTCRGCESRDRYRNDSEYREKNLAYSHEHFRRQKRTLTAAQLQAKKNTQYAIGLKKKFGITMDDYERKLAEQGGVCQICKRACPSGRRLAVDHNHDTGAVRSLLCGPCNRGIGMFGEDPDRLRIAISYLEDWMTSSGKPI